VDVFWMINDGDEKVKKSVEKETNRMKEKQRCVFVVVCVCVWVGVIHFLICRVKEKNESFKSKL
jgi:hypothetical protein